MPTIEGHYKAFFHYERPPHGIHGTEELQGWLHETFDGEPYIFDVHTQGWDLENPKRACYIVLVYLVGVADL